MTRVSLKHIEPGVLKAIRNLNVIGTFAMLVGVFAIYSAASNWAQRGPGDGVFLILGLVTLGIGAGLLLMAFQLSLGVVRASRSTTSALPRRRSTT